MKALTLRHPWAFAIAHWNKRIENRTWSPPPSLLGQRFAIHGGKPPGKADGYRLDSARVFGHLYNTYGHPKGFDEETTYRELMHIALNEMSGIVATAIVNHTVRTSDDPWFDGSGYGWVLQDVIVLPDPIQCKGAQGLWTVPSDIEERLRGQGAA